MTVETINSQQKNHEFRTEVQLYAKFEIHNDKDYNLNAINEKFVSSSKWNSNNDAKYDICAYRDSLQLQSSTKETKDIQIKYKQIVQAVIPPHFPSMIFLVTRFLSHLLYVNFRFRKDTYATRLLALISNGNSNLVTKAVDESNNSGEKNGASNNVNEIEHKKLVDVGTSPMKKPIILHRPVRIFIADGTLETQGEQASQEPSFHATRDAWKYATSDRNKSINDCDSLNSRVLRHQVHRPVSVNGSIYTNQLSKESIKFDRHLHSYEKPQIAQMGNITTPTLRQASSIQSEQSDQTTVLSIRHNKEFNSKENICHDQRCHNYLRERKIPPTMGTKELHRPTRLSKDRDDVLVKSECNHGDSRHTVFYDDDAQSKISYCQCQQKQVIQNNRGVTFGKNIVGSLVPKNSSPETLLKIYRPRDCQNSENLDNFPQNRNLKNRTIQRR